MGLLGQWINFFSILVDVAKLSSKLVTKLYSYQKKMRAHVSLTSGQLFICFSEYWKLKVIIFFYHAVV